MNKILLFNPRSANNKYRIPDSILDIAALDDGKYNWLIVDGNCEHNPMLKIDSYLSTGEFKYFGFTVMPGPQLRQTIIAAKTIRQKYPDTKMIWGGYFPSNDTMSTFEDSSLAAAGSLRYRDFNLCR